MIPLQAANGDHHELQQHGNEEHGCNELFVLLPSMLHLLVSLVHKCWQSLMACCIACL